MARILYIEDEPCIRDATVRLLRRKGHSVIERENTACADQLVEIWNPDLVITDQNLGYKNEKGIELALRLKKKRVKVVMLSGSLEVYDKACEAAIPFFCKPYSIVALLEEVEI
jgi:CheY-like chemotaxis protein